MKRYAFWLALASMSLSPFALPSPAFATKTEAQKFCSEQWDAEKKSNTIPRGMTHEKYMNQCTKNYAANNTNPTPPATEQPPSNEPAVWPAAPAAPATQSTTTTPAH